MPPYLTRWWISIVIHPSNIHIITKKKVDILERVIYVHKDLIKFILEQNLKSPQTFTILNWMEEVGGKIDAVAYSPDEQRGMLFLKDLYYITKN